MSSSQFESLYPEIDPTEPLSLSLAERAALTAPVVVLAFGAALPHLVTTVVGAVLVVAALAWVGGNTRRRVRATARARFPEEDWAEDEVTSALRLGIFLPAVWLALLIVALATAFFVPDSAAPVAATVVAVLAGAATWLMPGINPLWHPHDSDEDSAEDEDGADDEGENSLWRADTEVLEKVPAKPAGGAAESK